ncbi:MAG: autotransporter domain-containing protein [Arenimonas sp.]
MPRFRPLSSAVAVALAFSGATQAQSFSDFVIFGDSLSDAGQYAALPPPLISFGEGSFTTNDDPVWAQLLGAELGFDITAANAGGTDYAWGGAPTDAPFLCVPTTLPCQTGAQQIDAYFGNPSTGGHADPNALYAVWLGANNIFNAVGNPATAAASVSTSVQQEIALLGSLQAAGANYIIVVNLPDIGKAPQFTNPVLFPDTATPANSNGVSQLVALYNATLNAGLGTLANGIIAVDAYGLLNDVLADPGLYGFTNTTDTACDLGQVSSSLFCNTSTMVSPDANQNYVFADGVHPTGAGHAIFAQAVLSELRAPGQISMLGQAGMKAFEDHSRVIDTQIFRGRGSDRADDTVLGFANLQYGNIGYDATANTPQTDLNQTSLTVGGDYRGNENYNLGGAITLSSQQIDAGGARIDGRAVMFSLYGVYNVGRAYFDAIASGGSDNFDVHRHIQLGAADRVEDGNTNGSQNAFALGAGYLFGDSIKHGPFVDVTWQKIDINDFDETGLASTQMRFFSFTRDSLISRIGYQLHGNTDNWHPYARLAYNNESRNDPSQVTAGLVGMNGHFTLPGLVPADNWWTADLGLVFDVNDSTTASVSYSGLFADDLQNRTTINFGVNLKF